MKRRVFKGLAVLMVSAGLGFFQGSANAGNRPGDSVKVIPRVSNPPPSYSHPVSNNTRYESRSTDAARVRYHTSETRNATRDQSRMTTRQQSASATDNRHDDAVCTSGNPKLFGVRCSENSECNWGARCVGQPSRCANTGTPCLSSAQCMVPGVCSSGGLSSVSNRHGGSPARPVPVSHNHNAGRLPAPASGGRATNPGVSSR